MTDAQYDIQVYRLGEIVRGGLAIVYDIACLTKTGELIFGVAKECRHFHDNGSALTAEERRIAIVDLALDCLFF